MLMLAWCLIVLKLYLAFGYSLIHGQLEYAPVCLSPFENQLTHGELELVSGRGGGVGGKAKMGEKEITLALSNLSVKVNDCLPCL